MMIGLTMKMMKMIGKMNDLCADNTDALKKTFCELFRKQMANQSNMLAVGKYDDFKSDSTFCSILPVDDTRLMSYHIQHLISEIGEILDADKRWKNFRNQKYNEDAKLEEIADCFIVLMNIAMFSGFDGIDLVEAISSKIEQVADRISDK